MVRRRGVPVLLVLLLGFGPLGPPPVPPTGAPGTVGRPDTGRPETVALAAAWARQGRTFLDVDPRGDGRAVEVVGDLAAAERIAVLVPGVGTTLADFDRGLGGVARRAPAYQARTLHAAVRAADPTARVAVVAWLGYDPPDGLGPAAARDERARAGAAALADLAWLLARHRPGAGVTLVGHSYGALVVGLAADRLPPQVTDLVALGGVGMGADRATEVSGSARVWAAQATDDWIRWLPPLRLFGFGHGTRPAAATFGARRLPVDGVRGHDGYLVPGSATLAALARIVLAAGAPR